MVSRTSSGYVGWFDGCVEYAFQAIVAIHHAYGSSFGRTSELFDARPSPGVGRVRDAEAVEVSESVFGYHFAAVVPAAASVGTRSRPSEEVDARSRGLQSLWKVRLNRGTR